jgi:hypothetical protein
MPYKLIAPLVLVCAGAAAQDLTKLTWTEISQDEIEFKLFSHFVPMEVIVRNTDRGYLIACEIYSAGREPIAWKWDFAGYKETRFLFQQGQLATPPQSVACKQSEPVSPPRT